MRPILGHNQEAAFLVEEALGLIPLPTGLPLPTGIQIAMTAPGGRELEVVGPAEANEKVGDHARTAFESAVPQWVIHNDGVETACPAVSGVPGTVGLAVPFDFHGRRAGVIHFQWRPQSQSLAADVLPCIEFLARLMGLSLVAGSLSGSLLASHRQRQETEDLYRRALAQANIVAYRRVEGIPGFTYAGAGMRELTGYEPGELTDEVWRGLLVEIQPRVGKAGDSIADLHKQARAGTLRVWRADYRIRRKDGTPRWLADTSIQTYDGDRYSGSLGILQDITDRKEAERARLEMAEQLRHSQHLESLGSLAGGIAHDFNNILAGIMGNASLGMMDTPQGTPTHECFSEIEQAATRAAELTAQMMAFAGKAHLKKERVDLGKLASEVAHLAESTLLKQTPIAVMTASGLPHVMADPAQMRQVILNLLVNASEAMEPGSGIVTVETTKVASLVPINCLVPRHPLPAGHYVALIVRDTGPGIPPGIMARLFEPFFTTKKFKRGLGLPAVAGIATALDGGIQVESQPGEGATFRVLLPFPKMAAPGAQAGGGEQGQNGEWKPVGDVLVADDDDMVRGLSVRLLTRMGFTPIEAADGQAAVETFDQNPGRFTAALVDLKMPRMGGDEVLAHIRREHAKLPVVLVSGYSESEIDPRLANDPHTAFLKKPFQPSALRETLKKLLNA